LWVFKRIIYPKALLFSFAKIKEREKYTVNYSSKSKLSEFTERIVNKSINLYFFVKIILRTFMQPTPRIMKIKMTSIVLISLCYFTSCSSETDESAKKVCSCVEKQKELQDPEFALGDNALIGTCLLENNFEDINNTDFEKSFKAKCPSLAKSYDEYVKSMQ
jgi:hypothetical protein